jgi:ankyrin repeat protein
VSAELVPEPLRKFLPLVTKWAPTHGGEIGWRHAKLIETKPEVLAQLEAFAAGWTHELDHVLNAWLRTTSNDDDTEASKFCRFFALLDALDISYTKPDPDPVGSSVAALLKTPPSERDAMSRWMAIRIILRYGEEGARTLPALRVATRDPDARVRAWAHAAIAIYTGDLEVGETEIRRVKGQVLAEADPSDNPLMTKLIAGFSDDALDYLHWSPEKRDADALTGAAMSGDTRNVIRLLRRTNADAPNKDGGRALNYAVAEGRDDVVRLLLEAGADPNFRDRRGECVLHRAVTHRHRDGVIQLLLEHGADVNVTSAEGKTPLGLAVEHGRREYIPLLTANRQ